MGGDPEAAGGSGGTATNLNNPGNAATWGIAGTGTNLHGYIPGSPTGSKVFGVDSNGDVVGLASSTNVWKHAFYLASGSTTAAVLPTLNPGDGFVLAYGLNNSGQVVGVDGPSAASDTTGQAVLWTQTSGTWGVTSLPSLDAGAYSWAYAINNTLTNGYGTVAGFSDVADGHQDATVWSYNGSSWIPTDRIANHNDWDPITNPNGCAGKSAALAINSAGDAVGWGQLLPLAPTPHAVEFKHDGTLVDLGGTGFGGSLDQANGINDSGVVVGSINNRAFIWDSVNSTRDMNTVFSSIIPAGWTLISATGIDNAGDIVGFASTPSVSQGVGFLISVARLAGDANLDGKVDINDLTVVLTSYNRTTGMTWSTGDFNSDGKVDINDLTIVLTHYNQSLGASAAGMSAVPEPGTLALLAAGLAGLLGYAGRRRTFAVIARE